ncbi:alpha/beta fold hydrolase [Piscinibacter sakaiensis]|uniref:alpha/beta fold hydrolase n=1 Tax=Piscinibacter sakaiensis TaxID=1547922 RepID=UPI003AAB1162
MEARQPALSASAQPALPCGTDPQPITDEFNEVRSMTSALPYTRLPGTPEPMNYWPGHGGIRIAADSWGPAGGPLVLLQHGGGQTRHAWKGAGEVLGAAGYHAVAFDARGHGDTDWAPDGLYGQDVMVRDLQCVVAALGNRRPVLVGASMGGGTSLVAVGEAHVDATALVLVDIAPNIEPEGVDNIQAFMNMKPDGFASLEEVAQAIGTYQPHRRRPPTLDGLAKNVRLGADGKYHWHWDPRFRTGIRNLDQRTRRLEACAANLALPTLLVRGGLSDILSEAGAQAFLKLCPTAEYVSITGAGHMVAGDRNDIFASAAIEFLQRVVPVDGEPVVPPHPVRPLQDVSGEDIVDVP